MIVETPNPDASPIEDFESKLQLIRDRVGSVALGYHTGLYMVGRPGTSKTFTVCQELERLGEPNVYRNARMTAWGLFCFLAEHPEHVVVIDDITTLFKNEQAMQTLLAALDGKPGEPRLVTYKSKDKAEIEDERQKVRDALRRFPDDSTAQIEATGLKKSTFYNRRKEVLAEVRAA